MKRTSFPKRYFSSILTPIRIFTGRNKLSWGNMLFVGLFLVSLMLMPVAMHAAKEQTIQFDQVAPHAFALDKTALVEGLEGATVDQDGKLSGGQAMLEQETDGAVGLYEPKAAVDNEKNAIVMNQSEIIVKDQDGYQFSIPYYAGMDLSKVTTESALDEFLNDAWYTQNKPFIFLSQFMMVASVLFVSTWLLILVTAGFLWMTKKSQIGAIGSFKEALNMTLNALGLPVLASTIIGFIYFDITIMLAITSLGMVLLIAWTFLKTRFGKEFQTASRKVDRSLGGFKL
ncbi:DUF1189 family protein [Listeria costaricensis]|uniref:DUF1189 family protein n=1 Tax=Listeria costaricensis TaxID=2026604 RepID=UPI0013C4074E|nr:DUF1189 family protein [Listeria costaricensis]